MGPGDKFSLSPVSKNNNKIVRNVGVGGSFGPISAIQPTNPMGVGGSPRPADSALSKSVVKRPLIKQALIALSLNRNIKAS